MYALIRPILFAASRRDPESAHDFVKDLLRRASGSRFALGLIESIAAVRHPALKTNVFGLDFPNPIGLAAGFDKNAVVVPALAALGFGFVEVGTVTQHAQIGNPRPRIFRFERDRALVNRMGFNNHGADMISQRLFLMRKRKVPIGVSIGKSKITPIDRALADYVYTLKATYAHADYFAVNVSSPNTPGLRGLQEKSALKDLLVGLLDEADQLVGTGQKRKPFLVKIAPDLTWEEIDDVLEIVLELELAGIIATNTTVKRDGLSVATSETGGLSGRPLTKRSLEVVRHCALELGSHASVIGVGGISSVEDVLATLGAGAKLVQLYTSFVYEGPFLPGRLNRGLVNYCDRQEFRTIADIPRFLPV